MASIISGPAPIYFWITSRFRAQGFAHRVLCNRSRLKLVGGRAAAVPVVSSYDLFQGAEGAPAEHLKLRGGHAGIVSLRSVSGRRGCASGAV